MSWSRNESIQNLKQKRKKLTSDMIDIEDNATPKLDPYKDPET